MANYKPKQCKQCGAEFTPTAPRATYRTPECFKAKNRERMKKYRDTNKDAARKAKAELEGNATPKLIETKWEAGDKTCILCGEPIDPTLKAPHNMSRTIEHLTPIARGGRHDIDNINFAHYGCNAQKQDRTLEEYREWRERAA